MTTHRPAPHACLTLATLLAACTGDVDAGPLDDGGENDAGPADDGGAHDAGDDAGALLDAGVVDAGALDAGPPPPDFVLHGVPVRFLDDDEADAFLATSDDFTEVVSLFDRQIRLRTADTVDDAAFRAHLGEQGRRWGTDERARYLDALGELDGALDGLLLDLPDEIVLVKTSGLDEFQAPYTRRNGIVVPASFITNGVGQELRLLSHELLHILTRHQPGFRDALYSVFGFVPTNVIAWPAALEDGRFTNPDAYTLAHALTVSHQGADVDVMPLYHWPDGLDAALALPGFLSAVDTFLLVVADTGDGTYAPVDDDGGVRLLPISETSYAAQVGANTTYIVHPDEVVASNFELVVRKRAGLPWNVPSPDEVLALEALFLP